MAKETKVEKQHFLLILQPLPGLGYGGPDVVKVPARIAKRFLNERAAVEIDEHLFKKYQRHAYSRDFLDEAIKIAKERGTEKTTIDKLNYLKTSRPE